LIKNLFFYNYITLGRLHLYYNYFYEQLYRKLVVERKLNVGIKNVIYLSVNNVQFIRYKRYHKQLLISISYTILVVFILTRHNINDNIISMKIFFWQVFLIIHLLKKNQ